MKKIIPAFFFSALVIVCCKSTSVPLTPGTDDETFAKTKWNDATLEQLNAGYKLYTDNCGRCHVLHKPTEYDEAKWTKVVPWMGEKKANLKQADQELILHYLLAKREVMLKKK